LREKVAADEHPSAATAFLRLGSVLEVHGKLRWMLPPASAPIGGQFN
jgi:hypothetical protein